MEIAAPMEVDSMRSRRFFLTAFFLTAICCSTLTARGATVISSLTGSFQSQGPFEEGFVFLNEDNVSTQGLFFSPIYPLGDFLNLWNTYCSSGPCNVSSYGNMAGMGVYFSLDYDFSGFVTSGQYADSLYSDSYSDGWSESASYNFIGTWQNYMGLTVIGKGSGSFYFSDYCAPECGDNYTWTSNGNIVTTDTPEPCSFVLVCTGVFGIAAAIRRRVQV